MKDCRFCQIEVEDEKAFKITEPTGEETFFCAECASDMVHFITSGEADSRKMEMTEGANTGYSGQFNVLPTSWGSGQIITAGVIKNDEPPF
jgi:hypothetical protein